MSPPPSTASDAVSVLVADSNHMQAQLLTSALRRHAEFRIVTCSMEMTSLLHSVASRSPRVALLSPNSAISPAENMAVLRQLHLAYPDVIKIVLVESSDRPLVISAFRSGARGVFSLSASNLRSLSKCIQRVAKGQIWANTEEMNYLLELVSEVPSLRVFNTVGEPLLTPREEQVVALVAEGLGNREVAHELNLSEHTVKKYLFRVFDKLGISTRVELVLYAVHHGDPRRAEWMTGRSPD